MRYPGESPPTHLGNGCYRNTWDVDGVFFIPMNFFLTCPLCEITVPFLHSCFASMELGLHHTIPLGDLKPTVSEEERFSCLGLSTGFISK